MGIPVVLIELKSPSREETDASEGYAQIRNYVHEIPSMFIYNCISVISDQLTSKAGTITSGEDRFMEWKTKDGNYEKYSVCPNLTLSLRECLIEKGSLILLRTLFVFLMRG